VGDEEKVSLYPSAVASKENKLCRQPPISTESLHRGSRSKKKNDVEPAEIVGRKKTRKVGEAGGRICRDSIWGVTKSLDLLRL